jgi:hypothetical protein
MDTSRLLSVFVCGAALIRVLALFPFRRVNFMHNSVHFSLLSNTKGVAYY